MWAMSGESVMSAAAMENAMCVAQAGCSRNGTIQWAASCVIALGFAAFIGCVFVRGYSMIPESPPLAINVSPHSAFAPAALHIELLIPRRAAKRVLEVFTESEDFIRSSAWDIDGASAPFLYVVEWRDVPVGEYLIVARLISADGHEDRATAQVHLF